MTTSGINRLLATQKSILDINSMMITNDYWLIVILFLSFFLVPVLDERIFDAAPYVSHDEQPCKQGQCEYHRIPVDRLVYCCIDRFPVDGGEQSKDTDEEADEEMNLQAQVFSGTKFFTAHASAGMSTSTDAATMQAIVVNDIPTKVKIASVRQQNTTGKAAGSDTTRAALPTTGSSFRKAPQVCHAEAEAERRLQRDDDRHVLQGFRVLQVVGYLGF